MKTEYAAAGAILIVPIPGAGRAPRRYRGRDIFEWLYLSGFFDITPEKLPMPSSKLRALEKPKAPAPGGPGRPAPDHDRVRVNWKHIRHCFVTRPNERPHRDGAANNATVLKRLFEKVCNSDPKFRDDVAEVEHVLLSKRLFAAVGRMQFDFSPKRPNYADHPNAGRKVTLNFAVNRPYSFGRRYNLEYEIRR